MKNAQELQKEIKIKAKEKGMNVKQLATASGLGVNAIYQITDRQGISCFSLAKIADVLECSMDELLGRNCAK